MNCIETISGLGVLPVVVLKRTEDALPLADALIAGGLPAAEITLRSPAALDCIRRIAAERPQLALGAGTVLSPEQADAAVEAGACYLVAPGFSEELVSHCIRKGYTLIPGVSTASEVTRAAEMGLSLLKFFPAEAAGGLPVLKGLHGPFPGIRFIPTGGVTLDNMGEYLSAGFISAIGGTFLAKEEDMLAGNWEKISDKCRKALDISLGFRLAHVGVNNGSAEEAEKAAARLSQLFRLPLVPGTGSTFSGKDVEFMSTMYYGTKGHIGFATLSPDRALYWFRSLGMAVREDTMRVDEKGLRSFYLEEEIAGFAVHVVRA